MSTHRIYWPNVFVWAGIIVALAAFWVIAYDLIAYGVTR